MATWFYLSFADGRLPKGEQWLGAVIVQANDLRSAIDEAWRLRINPGGEVAGVVVEHLPPLRFRNRLLISKAELRDMGEATSNNPTLLNLDGKLIKPEGVEDDPY